MNNYIEINHTKTCNCSSKCLSCLPPKEWMKCQIGVWEFKYEQRDVRDKNLHPATFPIALPKKIIELFTHKGELVLDPFVGSGTTLVAAQDCERNAIGFDLNEKYIELAKSRIVENLASKAVAICDDAKNISNYVEPKSIKLVVTSPPYANILNHQRTNKSRRGNERHNEQYGKVEQYSQDPRDLGILEAPIFEKAIAEVFFNLKPILTNDANVLINITDAWIDKKRVPLHINVINAMQCAGYSLKNTIIWDRRNIVNRIGIFGWPNNYITMGTTFEYILNFVKD